MAYEKQVWNDDVTGFTSITPAMLNHMEEGIAAAHEVCDSISHKLKMAPSVNSFEIGFSAAGEPFLRFRKVGGASVVLILGSSNLRYANDANGNPIWIK